MLENWTSELARGPSAIDGLHQFVRGALGDCDFGADIAVDEADVRLTRARLGQVGLLHYSSFGRQWSSRSVSHLRSDRSDEFLVYLPRSAEIGIEQSGRSAMLRPGSFGLLSSARTYRGSIGPTQDGGFSSYHVRIPGALLRARVPLADELVGCELPLTAEIDVLLEHLMSVVFSGSAAVATRSAELWGASVMETLCAAVGRAAELVPEAQVQPQRPREATRARAQAIILANLGDPELSVESIARRLNVSPRCLHASFAGSGESVSTWIRRQRLERCRADLLAPELRGRTVSETAFRWGFNDFAHFSRCYKAAFGHSPSKARQIAH